MMNQPPVRVLIVDDHQVVRDGLKLMLSVSPGLACVGEAENGDEAIRMCAELMPDVILMDLIMPITDGVSATRMIRQQHPDVQVVVLTTFDDRDLVQKALRAGAVSYILKNASMEMITNTIRDAAVGRSTIAASAIQALIESEEGEMPGQELSAREKETLLLMADGLKNAAIAEKLCVSEATVRFHVSNILRKLGAANRTQAVRIAVDQGLIR